MITISQGTRIIKTRQGQGQGNTGVSQEFLQYHEILRFGGNLSSFGRNSIWCRRPDLNRHDRRSLPPQDSVSTNSTTSANSDRRYRAMPREPLINYSISLRGLKRASARRNPQLMAKVLNKGCNAAEARFRPRPQGPSEQSHLCVAPLCKVANITAGSRLDLRLL